MRENSKGTVGIESVQGRLRLRLPRQLYSGKQRYITLGLVDTVANRKVAQVRAAEIQFDITCNCFDFTLTKYVSNYFKPVSQEELTLPDLWLRFVAYRKSSWKPTTFEYIRTGITPLVSKLEDLKVKDSLLVKERLESLTTVFQVKRVITYLSAACKWGLRNDLVPKNTFEGMASEMLRFNYQDNPRPLAFSVEEMAKVLQAFKNHEGNFNKRNGAIALGYSYYASLVEFWFKTGCRPSEAIGLRWKNVASDCTSVTFAGSIVTCASGKVVELKKSKNNRVRKFPCSESLTALLLEIKPSEYNPENLVFPSPKGKVINYNNFSKKAWKQIVNPIKVGTTPYSCRDTFITLQIIAGIPETVIAKWVDTSVEMIERHYADALKLEAIRPLI